MALGRLRDWPVRVQSEEDGLLPSMTAHIGAAHAGRTEGTFGQQNGS